MLAIIGAITGIIGAIAGIGGLIMGAKSLHQTRNLKSQELRMDRSRLINNTDISLFKVKNLLEEANQSRVRRLAAEGNSQSGAMAKWNKSAEDFKNTIKALETKQFEVLGTAVLTKDLSLEEQIQRLHLIEQHTNMIIEDLNKSITEDDKARENLLQMRINQA